MTNNDIGTSSRAQRVFKRAYNLIQLFVGGIVSFSQNFHEVFHEKHFNIAKPLYFKGRFASRH